VVAGQVPAGSIAFVVHNSLASTPLARYRMPGGEQDKGSPGTSDG
jgi:hypothetical protein